MRKACRAARPRPATDHGQPVVPLPSAPPPHPCPPLPCLLQYPRRTASRPRRRWRRRSHRATSSSATRRRRASTPRRQQRPMALARRRPTPRAASAGPTPRARWTLSSRCVAVYRAERSLLWNLARSIHCEEQQARLPRADGSCDRTELTSLASSPFHPCSDTNKFNTGPCPPRPERPQLRCFCLHLLALPA